MPPFRRRPALVSAGGGARPRAGTRRRSGAAASRAGMRRTRSASSVGGREHADCSSTGGRSSSPTTRRATTTARSSRASWPPSCPSSRASASNYFSYVDPTGYGCGTKLPHNVTSLLGVMDGAQSDLRTGLPWQMVEIHEPTRLAIVVEGTRDRLRRVVEANPTIERLVRHRWIWLACLDAESGTLWELRATGFAAHTRTRPCGGRGRIGGVVPRQARIPSSGGDRARAAGSPLERGAQA